MEIDLITCKECNIHKSITKFYSRAIKEKLINNKYQPFVICKDCIKKEYLTEYEKVHNDFKQTLIIMCTKYNIYYDDNLMKSIKENNMNDGLYLFQQYIKNISSLSQYIGLKYKDSVWEKEETKSLNINTDEKSDIDFIDDDIKMIKRNMKKATFDNDANSHGKWMNSLRDALELRENLIVKEAIEIDKKNSIIIGNALKNISERIICHDILGKVNEMAGIITSNDNVYDILKGISHNWNHLSKETRDDLAKLIAGEKHKSYLIVLLDNLESN